MTYQVTSEELQMVWREGNFPPEDFFMKALGLYNLVSFAHLNFEKFCGILTEVTTYGYDEIIDAMKKTTLEGADHNMWDTLHLMYPEGNELRFLDKYEKRTS